MSDEPLVPALGDMPPEEFRKAGHAVVDRIADYLASLDGRRVFPAIEPGDVKARIPQVPPEAPEGVEAALRDFDAFVLPNITHWQHPNFMAYFPSVACGPGILGEMLAAGLNSNVMFWKNAPASTEVEERVVEWLRAMLDLPAAFDGMLTDTASISSLLSFVAAREAHPKIAGDRRGLAGRDDLGPLVAYQSEEAHMSLDKAARVCGVGLDFIRKIETDDVFRMKPEALAEAIEADLAAGRTPFVVSALLGTTSSTAMDPVDAIADVCERHGVWLHVDAAYAGAAAILPERRAEFRGWERADSIVFNPHKWMFTPFDASLLLFRDPEAYRRAFSLVPEYLKASEGDVRNYNEYGVQLGRRFRALKLWFQIRYFGVEGIRARLRRSIDQAAALRERIEATPAWEMLAPTPYSTLCFRWNPGNLDDAALEAANAAILDRVNAAGTVYLSHTKLAGRFTLRVALGNPRTEDRHVERCWRALTEAAQEEAGRRGC